MPTIFSSSARKVSRDALLAKNDEVSIVTEAPMVEQKVEPGEEISPEVQQTFFAEDIVIQQEAHHRPKSQASEAPAQPQPKWKSYVPLAAVLGGSLILVLGIGVLLRPQNANPVNVDVVPTPASENGSPLSVLQRELVLLEKDVEAADPLQAKLAFPPVNFSLKLEEATLLQQENSNRFR